jgi:hypothetical protein
MSQFTPPPVESPKLVGTYDALAGAGGGFVWDAVLEYRVWCHPTDSDDDYFCCFETYGDAFRYHQDTPGSEEPLALIRQDEFIDEPTPGEYVHVRSPRIAEWPVEFLRRPRRTAETIPNFFAPDAPPDRLAILCGERHAPS